MTAPTHRPDCPGPGNGCTLGSHNAAETARQRGWPAGTLIEGTDERGTATRLITAVGQDMVLAAHVDCTCGDVEMPISFAFRCWGVVVDDEPREAQGEAA